MKPTFKAVMFDFDGTLADTVPDCAAAANFALQEMGLPTRSMEEVKSFVGRGLRNLGERCLPEDSPCEADIDRCHAYIMDYYRAHPADHTVLFEGILPVLEHYRSKGLRLSVLSNKADELTQRILVQLGIAPFLDAATGLRDDFPRKPDPKSALWLLGRMARPGETIQPSEVLYVGDSGVDMQTAKAAGFYALGVSWGYRPVEDLLENGAQAIVDTPGQLLKFID